MGISPSAPDSSSAINNPNLVTLETFAENVAPTLSAMKEVLYRSTALLSAFAALRSI